MSEEWESEKYEMVPDWKFMSSSFKLTSQDIGRITEGGARVGLSKVFTWDLRSDWTKACDRSRANGV